MNRRSFLGRAALHTTIAATVASWPALLREAFAADSDAPGQDADARARAERIDGLAVVSEGYKRAQQAGKPLLVFIIPSEGKNADAQKYPRGQAFGAFLNHGSAEQLWPLALCEVVCATLGAVRELVPSVGLGDPLMVLVETAAVPATVTRLDTKLPEVQSGRMGRFGSDGVHSWEEMQQRESAAIDANTRRIAELVRQAVAKDAAAIGRRAAQARAALGPGAQAALGGLGLDGVTRETLKATAKAAHPLAALVAEQAAGLGTQAQRRRWDVLHAAVTAQVLRQRVPGSHWANASGCGTDIEDVPTTSIIGCGMGHVPQKSARFLYFFAVRKDGSTDL